MTSPGADVSVRIAWADDAAAIARVQLRAWPTLYADLVPAEAIPSGPEAEEAAAAAWRSSFDKPGDARNRVLVALERNRVVGFAITGPATDPDRDPVADAELARAHRRPRRAAQGARLPAAAGGGRHDDRRPVQPRGDLGGRGRRRAADLPDRRGVGAPTRRTASSTSTAPGRPGSSRCGCTPGSREPARGTGPDVCVGQIRRSTRAKRHGLCALAQLTLTALQAAATVLYFVEPAP